MDRDYAIDAIAIGIGLVVSGVLILACLGLFGGKQDCGCGETGGGVAE